MFIPSYNQLGQANFQPGHMPESSPTNQTRAAIFDPFPLISAATFAGNTFTVAANVRYQLQIVDFQGAIFNSLPYTMPAVIDLPGFNAWFNNAIASVATNVTPSPATAWGTATVVNLQIFQRSFLANSNLTIRITQTVAGVSTNFFLANVAPQTNTGLATFQAGRFLVRDVQNENATIAGNPYYNARQTQYTVKLIDTATVTAFGLNYLAGVGLYIRKRQNPFRDVTSGYGIFDTVRVINRGCVIVQASTAATFNNQIVNNIFVETAPGVNQGTVTNVASATAFSLSSASGLPLVSEIDCRGYNGNVKLRLNLS